jgi:hypothetical protein
MKMDELEDYVAMTVHAVCVKMLKCLAAELKAA